MRMILISIVALFYSLGSFAQDTLVHKSPTFAIAVFNQHYDCIVKYSDGSKFNLTKALSLSNYMSLDEMDIIELKVLDYFDKNNYELLSVVNQTYGERNILFYFKLRQSK